MLARAGLKISSPVTRSPANSETPPGSSRGSPGRGRVATDFEEEELSMYGARLQLRPGKKIELIIEPMDQR